MSNPQDPYAPRSGELPPAPPPPPAGWPVPAGGPPPAGWPGPVAGPSPGAQPGVVIAAVVFWVLAGLTMLLSGAATIATARTQETKQALADLFADSQLQVSDTMIEQLLLATGVASLAVGVLNIAFGLILLSGANWARITVTVLGLLGVLIMLFPAPFVALAIVLQFLPASNTWFRSRSARRRPA